VVSLLFTFNASASDSAPSKPNTARKQHHQFSWWTSYLCATRTGKRAHVPIMFHLRLRHST
jgi:hypothetical protein